MPLHSKADSLAPFLATPQVEVNSASSIRHRIDHENRLAAMRWLNDVLRQDIVSGRFDEIAKIAMDLRTAGYLMLNDGIQQTADQNIVSHRLALPRPASHPFKVSLTELPAGPYSILNEGEVFTLYELPTSFGRSFPVMAVDSLKRFIVTLRDKGGKLSVIE